MAKGLFSALILLSAFAISGCGTYDPAVRMGKKGAIGVDYQVLSVDIERLMEMGRPIPPPFGYRR